MLTDVDMAIVVAVRELGGERRLGRAVLPFDVWEFGEEFGVYAVEGSIRRRMSRLAERGLLVRVGGEGSRRGYLVPDWRRVRVEHVTRLVAPVFDNRRESAVS